MLRLLLPGFPNTLSIGLVMPLTLGVSFGSAIPVYCIPRSLLFEVGWFVRALAFGLYLIPNLDTAVAETLAAWALLRLAELSLLPADVTGWF